MKNRFGNFNDKFENDTKILINYFTLKNVKVLKNIDLYYILLNKKNSTFNTFSGREIRSSIGSRIFGKNKFWNYDFEAIYQFGKLENHNISAWTISLNNSINVSMFNINQKIGFKSEYISGDTNSSNSIETFNPLFPKGAYFGLAALIGPSNLIDIHPYWEFELTKKMNFNMDYDIFWRASVNDGIYQPNAKVLFESLNSSSTKIGDQLGFQFAYEINNYFNFAIEGTWFKSGRFIKEVSNGDDIFFASSTFTLKF